MRWALPAVAIGASSLAACSGTATGTYVGPVTEVGNRVCIGGANAAGECFSSDHLTRDLHVNDCVQVTYDGGSQQRGPFTAMKIKKVVATAHRRDCPS